MSISELALVRIAHALERIADSLESTKTHNVNDSHDAKCPAEYLSSTNPPRLKRCNKGDWTELTRRVLNGETFTKVATEMGFPVMQIRIRVHFYLKTKNPSLYKTLKTSFGSEPHIDDLRRNKHQFGF